MIVRELVNLIGFKINESQFKAAESRVKSFERNLDRFGKQATLFLTAPFIGLNIWLGKTLSEFEQLDVAFETMLGSADKANILVKDMLQFAAKTPFEIKEIGPTVKQLLAVGIESDNVLSTLKALGDVASGLSVPVSRLALNFGQIKTQGKLTGRELRDFSMAGVPLIAELSKMLNVADKDITDMVSRGEIGFDKVDQAFKNMTSSGGRFANLMERQAKTLGGMYSNFKDLITLSVKDYSGKLIPVFKGIIEFGIKILDIFKNKISSTMKETIFILTALAAAIGPLILAFTALVKIGMFVRGTLLAVAGAARVANMSTSLFLLKFALMGIAIVGSITLAIALFEDITIYLQGGNSLIGRIIERLTKLNDKLKEMGIFTLDQIKNTFKTIDNLFTNFMDTIVGLFMGKWKFALDSLKNMFINLFRTLANIVGIVTQPILDIINKVSGNKLQAKNIGSGIASVVKSSANASMLLPAPGFGTAAAFNTSVNLTLPNNPSSEQIEAVGGNVETAINEAIKKASRSLVTAMPELE